MKNTSTPIDPKNVGGVPNTTNPTTVTPTTTVKPRQSLKQKLASRKAVSASKINTGNMVAEAGPGVLPQSIVDKAILKAAQEAEIMNTKQGKTSSQQAAAGGVTPDTGAGANTPAAGGTGSGSSGGFGAGLKSGFTGKTKAAPDLASLEQRIAAIEKKVGLA